jgi:hypothetical protein
LTFEGDKKDSARDNTYTVYDLYKISITPRHKLKETTKEWRSQGNQTNSGSKNKSFFKPSERRILIEKGYYL